MIRQRLATAIVLAALLLGAIVYLPKPAFIAALAALFLGGFWEWAGFLGVPFGARRLPFVGLGAAALVLTYLYIFRGSGDALPFLAAAAVWWVVALAWVARYPAPVPRAAIIAAAFLVLVPAWLGLSLLFLREPRGALWLLTAFVLVFAADTGAYFAGRAFGRHKLAPAVSPGKTWEGVAGGLTLSVMVAAGLATFLDVSPLYLGLAAVPIALASVVGDLIISLFKRNADLKDSGRLFPGHGGILDRIDSVCAAAPLLTLGLYVLERA